MTLQFNEEELKKFVKLVTPFEKYKTTFTFTKKSLKVDNLSQKYDPMEAEVNFDFFSVKPEVPANLLKCKIQIVETKKFIRDLKSQARLNVVESILEFDFQADPNQSQTSEGEMSRNSIVKVSAKNMGITFGLQHSIIIQAPNDPLELTSQSRTSTRRRLSRRSRTSHTYTGGRSRTKPSKTTTTDLLFKLTYQDFCKFNKRFKRHRSLSFVMLKDKRAFQVDSNLDFSHFARLSLNFNHFDPEALTVIKIPFALAIESKMLRQLSIALTSVEKEAKSSASVYFYISKSVESMVSTLELVVKIEAPNIMFRLRTEASLCSAEPQVIENSIKQQLKKTLIMTGSHMIAQQRGGLAPPGRLQSSRNSRFHPQTITEPVTQITGFPSRNTRNQGINRFSHLTSRRESADRGGSFMQEVSQPGGSRINPNSPGAMREEVVYQHRSGRSMILNEDEQGHKRKSDQLEPSTVDMNDLNRSSRNFNLAIPGNSAGFSNQFRSRDPLSSRRNDSRLQKKLKPDNNLDDSRAGSIRLNPDFVEDNNIKKMEERAKENGDEAWLFLHYQYGGKPPDQDEMDKLKEYIKKPAGWYTSESESGEDMSSEKYDD